MAKRDIQQDGGQQAQDAGEQNGPSAGQASCGHSGAAESTSQHEPSQQAAQGSAADARANADDMMQHEHDGTHHSTEAQRSGGQSDGGRGMGNESFKGSSLGGQTGEDSQMFGAHDEGSDGVIDPTNGQPSEGFDREGQGVGDQTMRSNGATNDQRDENPLNWE